MTNINEADHRVAVLLVSGRRLFAEALASSLEASRAHVVGVLPTLAALRAQPVGADLVLMFGGTPDGSLTEGIRAARAALPDAALVAGPDSDRLEDVLSLLQTGADGYVLRSSSLEDLLQLVDRAGRRETLVPPAVIREIAQRVDAANRGSRDAARLGALTRREMEVLRSLKEGFGPRAIAERDGTSPATVRTHVQSILRKLGTHSILEAVTFSLRHGIVDAPSIETAVREDDPVVPTNLFRAS